MVMSRLPFCTCKDTDCPLNPVNHDRGCDLCVAKCLRKREIPSCFFHLAGPLPDGWEDYSFEGFARLTAEKEKKSE